MDARFGLTSPRAAAGVVKVEAAEVADEPVNPAKTVQSAKKQTAAVGGGHAAGDADARPSLLSHQPRGGRSWTQT